MGIHVKNNDSVITIIMEQMAWEIQHKHPTIAKWTMVAHVNTEGIKSIDYALCWQAAKCH